MKTKLGYVEWFDNSTGEGMIRCPSDKASYYVHWSAIKYGPEGAKTLEKHRPVRIKLYENLYMKQVDSVEPVHFNWSIKHEHELAQLMNDLWEDADTRAFDIAKLYYEES